jgi:hypothetical protein
MVAHYWMPLVIAGRFNPEVGDTTVPGIAPALPESRKDISRPNGDLLGGSARPRLPVISLIVLPKS